MCTRHALILLFLTAALSGCVGQAEDDDSSGVSPRFTVRATLANNGSKEAFVWLNITPPNGQDIPFGSEVAGHERIQYNQTLDANGTFLIEVTWFTEGERLDAAGQELFYDSFKTRKSFPVNGTRCSDGEAFTISSNMTYTSSDSPLLGPLTRHGFATETRYDGCGSRGIST